jgi:hypothetical protein
MSDTSTKRALEVAKFHEVSEELYADNPEDSGRRAMHHISANLLRALAAERDGLRAALSELVDIIEHALEIKSTEDMDSFTLQPARAALGEKE